MPDSRENGSNRGNQPFQDNRPSNSNTVSSSDQAGTNNEASSRPCSPPVLGPTARGATISKLFPWVKMKEPRLLRPLV